MGIYNIIMALATRKSSDIFNKNTGGDTDSKTIDTSTETEIRDKFNNGDHILDEGMFENLAPALYAIQQLSEDIEELRRYVQSEITSITSAQASAITANTAKTGLTSSQTTILSNLANLPTRRGASGTLYNDRGIVRVS